LDSLPSLPAINPVSNNLVRRRMADSVWLGEDILQGAHDTTSARVN